MMRKYDKMGEIAENQMWRDKKTKGEKSWEKEKDEITWEEMRKWEKLDEKITEKR